MVLKLVCTLEVDAARRFVGGAFFTGERITGIGAFFASTFLFIGEITFLCMFVNTFYEYVISYSGSYCSNKETRSSSDNAQFFSSSYVITSSGFSSIVSKIYSLIAFISLGFGTSALTITPIALMKLVAIIVISSLVIHLFPSKSKSKNTNVTFFSELAKAYIVRATTRSRTLTILCPRSNKRKTLSFPAI
jgi:hypothetical protein